MRIEINSGGFGGSAAIHGFQSDMSGFISNADRMISCFKAVRSETYGLSGGVGSLQGALDDISGRVQNEEEIKASAIAIKQKTNDFHDLALRVDRQVSSLVNQNKDEFYQVNPWLRPAVASEESNSWYEEAWNWVSDSAGKIWNGLVEYYRENKKVIDTVLIVVGTILAIAGVIASGGWALVPLLVKVFAISATKAVIISQAVAVTAVVATSLSSTLNVIDVWADVDHPIFNTVQKVLSITSTVVNLGYSLGNIYNSLKGYRIVDYRGNKVVINDKAFDPKLVDAKNRNYIERMRDGLAPIGKDGKAIEMHHIYQTKDGGLFELTMTEHRGAGNFSFWHTTDPKYESVVDHGYAWTNFKKAYWKWRGKENFAWVDAKINASSINNIVKPSVDLYKFITNE